MESKLGHLQLNVDPSNIAFYKDLLGFLGWSPIMENESMLGVTADGAVSLWILGATNNAANDYDGPGLNHLGLAVPSQAEVDATAEYLRDHDIRPLFDTPRHRPEFSGDDSTYYQVMFESPDRILFEVVYTGPKSE